MSKHLQLGFQEDFIFYLYIELIQLRFDNSKKTRFLNLGNLIFKSIPALKQLSPKRNTYPIHSKIVNIPLLLKQK